MDNVAIIHTVFDALEAGDFEKFLSLFDQSAVIWQNFTGRDTPVAEVAAMLESMLPGLQSDCYEDRRYIAIEDGVIAQHTKRATRLDGLVVEIPIMLRIFIDGGVIKRIEEYFDLGQAASLAGE
jgi:ketosteroid isomerase-like protein